MDNNSYTHYNRQVSTVLVVIIFSILLSFGIAFAMGWRWPGSTITREVQEQEMEIECVESGFNGLYIYDSVEPPLYYCVELPVPAVGEPGTVVRVTITDGIILPFTTTPAPPEPTTPPTGMEKYWEVKNE